MASKQHKQSMPQASFSVAMAVWPVVAALCGAIFAAGSVYATMSMRETSVSSGLQTEKSEREKALADEAQARKDAVKQLLDSNGETIKQLSSLDKHAAVQDEQTKQIASTLDKISVQLSNLTVTTMPMSKSSR